MNVLALCAGVGGLELGVHLAEPGSHVVCYVEREAAGAAILVARMEDGYLPAAPIWSDLTTFNAGPWRGVVDCVTAGFPCQPFSVAGKRLGTTDERWIWASINDIIRDLEPRFVFLENVPGLLASGLGHVLGSLASLGFGVEWGVFGAGSVGAPHQRHRVFILGYRNEVGRSWRAGLAGAGRRGESSDSGKVLANADSQGSQVGLIQYGRELAPPERSGDPLADASCQRLGTPERNILSGQPDPAGSSAGLLADARRIRERGLQPEPESWSSSAFSTGRAGQDMGNPEDCNPLASVLPLWPPGPAGDWGAIPPGLWPTQSRVRGVADGLPARLDQLRALGNGVVPLAAAVAFVTLATRAGIEVENGL